MKQLTSKGLFREQRDVSTLGAAIGIAFGKTSEQGDREAFQNINSLDQDGVFRAFFRKNEWRPGRDSDPDQATILYRVMSCGRQPHILFRQHEEIHGETGLYYLGYLYDGLSAATILIALSN